MADPSILDYLNQSFHAEAQREEGVKLIESGVLGRGDRRAARDDRDGLGVRGGKLKEYNVVKDDCEDIGVVEPKSYPGNSIGTFCRRKHTAWAIVVFGLETVLKIMLEDASCTVPMACFEEKVLAIEMVKECVLSFDNHCIDSDTHNSQMESHPFENNPTKSDFLYDDSECCYKSVAEGHSWITHRSL